MEEKKDFWEDLDVLIKSISKEERIILGADLNGHVGEGNIGDEEIMGRYGAGTRNKEEPMFVDFGKRMDWAIVNTYFKKKDEHRVTYKSGGKSTHVDYVMCRRRNLKEMCECKVVLNECVAKLHRMDSSNGENSSMQNSSNGENKKSRESKTKDTIVKTEGDKLLRSI